MGRGGINAGNYLPCLNKEAIPVFSAEVGVHTEMVFDGPESFPDGAVQFLQVPTQ